MKKIAALTLISWTLSACTTMLETDTLESVNRIALASVYISKDIAPTNNRAPENIDSRYQLDRHQADAQQLVLTDLLANAEQSLQALNIWQIVPSSHWLTQSPLTAPPPKLMPDNSPWVIKEGLAFLPTLNAREDYNPFEKKYVQSICERLGVDAIGILQIEFSYKGTGLLGSLGDANQITPQAEARFMLITKTGEVAMDSKQYPSLFVGRKMTLPVNLGSQLGTFRLASPEGKYTRNYLEVAHKSTDYVLSKISTELVRLGPRAFNRLPSQPPLKQITAEDTVSEEAINTNVTSHPQVAPAKKTATAKSIPVAVAAPAPVLTPAPAQKMTTPVLINPSTPTPSQKDATLEPKIEKNSSPLRHLEMATSAPPIMNLELPTDTDDIQIDIDLSEEEQATAAQKTKSSDPWGLNRYRREDNRK